MTTSFYQECVFLSRSDVAAVILSLPLPMYILVADASTHADSPRTNGRQNVTPSGSRPRDPAQDTGSKLSRGAEGTVGRDTPPRYGGSDHLNAGSLSRQEGQGKAPDKTSVPFSLGVGGSAPLPPYPRSGSRSQPQPPVVNPPYSQPQHSQGHGQGQGYSYPSVQQQRMFQQNQNHPQTFNDCYSYSRSNIGIRGFSDHPNQPNMNTQSHRSEDGRPRPPQGPPKGPGRGPQPPLPPIPAPPTR